MINGEKHITMTGTPLMNLLESLGVRRGSVVVERNGQVVENNRLVGVVLEPDDRLEITRVLAEG
jgi:thiamine biosynthesis protein ThiS